MRTLLTLLSLICCLFSSAHAQAPEALPLPYGADTVLSVLDLTDAQHNLVHFLYTPIFNGAENIPLPKGTRYADVAPAMACLMQDYPELFHLGRDYTIGYYRGQPEIATYIEPQYRMGPQEAADLRVQLYTKAYLLVDASPDALTLHDTLCSLTSYGGDTEMRHTAVGALLKKQATCEGYAQALTLLCRMAGIPCGVVVGTATDSAGMTDRHAWNIADMGGFTLIDATWNDQDRLGLNTHWYYGLSTGQMAADHTPDADQRVPLCDAHANWHDRHGYIVSSTEQADAAIRRLVTGEPVNLRMDNMMYAALTDDFSTWLERYNQRNPDAAFFGAYSMTCSDAQLCVILQRTE